jgi:hypothetical protein
MAPRVFAACVLRRGPGRIGRVKAVTVAYGDGMSRHLGMVGDEPDVLVLPGGQAAGYTVDRSAVSLLHLDRPIVTFAPNVIDVHRELPGSVASKAGNQR